MKNFIKVTQYTGLHQGVETLLVNPSVLSHLATARTVDGNRIYRVLTVQSGGQFWVTLECAAELERLLTGDRDISE